MTPPAAAIAGIVKNLWLAAYDRGRFSTASKHGTYADVVPKAVVDILTALDAADTWRPIEEVDHCFPVLVARAADTRLFYDVAVAFRDATGVWRYIGGGGMHALDYVPTHYMRRPAAPLANRVRP